jgi:hypothetical protein
MARKHAEDRCRRAMLASVWRSSGVSSNEPDVTSSTSRLAAISGTHLESVSNDTFHRSFPFTSMVPAQRIAPRWPTLSYSGCQAAPVHWDQSSASGGMLPGSGTWQGTTEDVGPSCLQHYQDGSPSGRDEGSAPRLCLCSDAAMRIDATLSASGLSFC